MTRFKVRLFPLLFLLMLSLSAPAGAQFLGLFGGDDDQTSPEEEKGFFLNYVEEQLSTENRRISISEIEGVLSSQAQIGQITVADRDGVWLTISNAAIDWRRRALLSGRLEINNLTAERIEVTRQPLPDEDTVSVIKVEATPFALPELPVAINIGELSAQRAVFAEPVFGLASELSLDGALSLEDGTLDANLQIERLDGPGGSLQLDAGFANENRELSVDLQLDEPADGVVANLLDLEGRPPISLSLAGDGPISDMALNLELAVDGNPLVQGSLALRQENRGLGFDTDLTGRIAPLIPAEFRSFVSGESALRLRGVVPDEGGTVVDALTLAVGPLSLQGNAHVLPGGFLRTLVLDGRIDSGTGAPVLLPVPGGKTSLRQATINLRYGEDEAGPWNGEIIVRNLATGTFAADQARFVLDGVAEALDDPNARTVSFNVDGAIDGIVAERTDVAEALGDRLDFELTGETSANQPVLIETLSVEAQSVAFTTSGELDGLTYRGRTAIDTDSLAPFSALAGQELTGALNVSADGSITFSSGAFDLALDGSATDVTLENRALSGLLQGRTTLSGGLARTEQGLAANDFRLANPQVTLAANGSYGGDNTNMTVSGRLADLAAVTDEASGAVGFDASLVGQGESTAVEADLTIAQARISERTLNNLAVGLSGTLGEGSFSGRIDGEGFYSGERLAVAGELATGDGSVRLSAADIAIGGNRLSGSIERGSSGLFEADLSVDAPNLALVGALAMQDLAGRIDAMVTLSSVDGRQDAGVDGTIADFRFADTLRIDQAALDVMATDIFGVPQADGSINGRQIAVAGTTFSELALTADRQDEATDFIVDARLEQGTEVDAAGALTRVPDADVAPAFDLTLTRLAIVEAGRRAELQGESRITVRGQTYAISDTTVAIGDGTLRIDGEVSDVLDLSVTADNVSLDIANAVRPDLGAAGTVSGNAEITGTRAQPDVVFDVTGHDLTVAQFQQSGIAPVDVRADGRTDGEQLAVDAGISNSQGVDASVRGTVPLSGDGALDIVAVLKAVPLDLINAVRPELDAGGTISGNASVHGTFAQPDVDFELTAEGLTAALLRQNGVAPIDVAATGRTDGRRLTVDATATNDQGVRASLGGTVPLGSGSMALDVDLTAVPLSLVNAARPELGLSGVLSGSASVTGAPASPNAEFSLSVPNLDAAALQGLGPVAVTAEGQFADQTVRLSRLAVNGPGGLTFGASGTIPLAGGGLDVSFEGSAPLDMANRFLSRGTTLGGVVRLSGSARGSLANPDVAATVDTAGASVFDPQTNTRLTDVTLSVTATREQAVIRVARANLVGGGSVSASGSVGLAGRLPANITINLNEARYADGQFIAATVNGTIRITGPLLANPLIAGNIVVARAEITVPDSFSSSADIQAVNHINAPADVRATLARAFPDTGGRIPVPVARPSAPRLNITLSAPNQIFVRGRGLDAELGGSLRLTGSTRSIQPVGGFELIRGRLSILGKRITFERGSITFVGDLNPYLNFVASSVADETTVYISVQGTVDDLDISFTSDPQLPEDEALAVLIFGRGISELSPLQLAQLAAAAAELAGNGPSILSGVREAAGLDELDIVTDAEGNTAARAGRYISDNIYVGVEAGENSKATINLDVTDEVTIRGSVGTESEIGIFFEMDY